VSQTSNLRLDIGWKTDIGRVRQNNEDSVAAMPEVKLFILSDGMGGEAHGEVASQLAVETIAHHIRAAQEAAADSDATQGPGFSFATRQLANAVCAANHKIFQSAQQTPGRHGMGATVVTARIDGPEMSIVSVGDSRAYLFRDDVLEQLTEDHTLVAEQVRRGLITPEQATKSRVQNVLVRALGVRDEVEPDLFEEELHAGDIMLLCSDGLTRMVADDAIAGALRQGKSSQRIADQLVAMALDHGGEDNVSVIVLRVLAK